MVKDKMLLNLVADLIEMLIEYGADTNSIIHTLTYYDFTEKEIKDWFGITLDAEAEKEGE